MNVIFYVVYTSLLNSLILYFIFASPKYVIISVRSQINKEKKSPLFVILPIAENIGFSDRRYSLPSLDALLSALAIDSRSS